MGFVNDILVGMGYKMLQKAKGNVPEFALKMANPRRSPFFYAPNFDYVSHAVEGKELLGAAFWTFKKHDLELRNHFFFIMELIPSGKRT